MPNFAVPTQPWSPSGALSAPPPPIAPGGGIGPPPLKQISPSGGGGQAQPQTPGPFGTGTYIPPAFPIDYGAITGNPNPGAGSNYGLNDVYSQLQNATNNLQLRNYSATAPVGTAATGAAAQGAASTYAPAQGSASGYGAALGQGSGYDAAQGRASSIGGVAGAAATGNAAYADPTRISTAGDLAWQAQQQQLANILARQAAGGGMSPADIQLRRGTEDQIAGNLAVLGSQRGSGNFALAQRSAADQRAQAEEALNSQMGLQRAQETIQAQQALGGVLGTARGQAQNYNINQADLLQQLRMGNAGLTQGMTLADLAAVNSQTQQNVGLAQQANEFNAGQGQAMTLADMAARDAALQYNAGNSQQAMLANQAAQNAASQYTAGNSQQMSLANLLARNNALQYNAGNTQGMTLADLAAQNQFGMANLENTQQTNLANTALAGQYGLANQSAALQANNQYYDQLLALLGAQGSIGQSNRAAGLAGQQLGVQQNTALDQIAAEAYAASAQANANLTGGIIGGIGALGAAGINAIGNAANAPTTYPLANGGTTTDPTDPGIYTDSPTGSLSDENVKTGIEGGNPMLDSFLRQYNESRGKTPDIDPDSGETFHVQRYSQALSGGSPGSGLGKSIGGAAGGLAGAAAGTAIFPGIGTAIGGLAGSLLGGAAGGAADSGGSPGSVSSRMSSPASGLQKIGVDDQELQEVSDENEKEAVTSGNRGLQAFLEQQNAQTNAQNQQGSYNNAFMQTGAPLQPRVNTQLPPNPNAGYGQPSLQDLLSSGYGGGGIADMGGYGSGGYQGGGITSLGSWYGAQMAGGNLSEAGIAQPGSMAPGGVVSGAGLESPSPAATAQLPPIATRSPTTPIGATSTTSALSPIARAQTVAPYGAAAYPFAPGAAGGAGLIALDPTTGGAFAPPAQPIYRSGPSTLARMSDETQKSEVSQDPGELRGFLDALHAHSYRYKDPDAPGAGHGRYVSPMAQELQKTDLGKSFVVKNTDGHLMVDYGKMAGTQLAATAMMNERVSKLEKLLGGPSSHA